MKEIIVGLVIALAVVGTVAVTAAADGKVTITREENKPATVEVKAGESVEWKNVTGGSAHIVFRDNEALQFYVGGKGASRVRFDKPGTYEYGVHVTGVKPHVHRGTVVVK